MSVITEIAASLSLWQYILIYVITFVLAIVIAAVGSQKSQSARESVIAVLALFGGILAVGYVSVRLEKNPGLLILVILSVFAAIIGYPAAMIADRSPKGADTEKKTAEEQHKKKTEKEQPDQRAIREAELRRKASKLSVKDIDNITDEALLCAYVRYVKYNSLGFPALKKITSDTYLTAIAADNSVDRKLQIYALENIRSDEIKATLVRLHKNEWLGEEAARDIKSQEIRFELFKEFPDLYLPSSGDPLILEYVLRNHLFADDSMDVTTGAYREHEKGSIYLEVMKSGNDELIRMLDPQCIEELTGICLDQVARWGYRTAPPGNEIRSSLECLKLIYHLNLCESKKAEIEALDGQTFNKYEIINYYDEREKCDGITFRLFEN